MGDYINLEKTGPNANDINVHLGYIKGLKGNPVWQIALMPYLGLESVTQEVANSIAQSMLRINQQGITVWLRFAHEMNGDWYKWGMQPELFLEKWKMVWEAIKSVTSSTYMLWAPNSLFGGLNDVKGGYTQYWPGAQYVDMLGLSFYHYGDLYSTPNNLPIVLSETGASYTVSLQTNEPAPGGASEHDMKFGWLQQLLANNLRTDVPNFKAFSWFEIKKNENASGGSAIKSEDFRLLMGNQDLSKSAVTYLSS
ncbi:family 26 glycoside hydrolase [Melampsora larici-populina 98AG31]|uniref:Family 26 glycoside hydrolase n=1 Tax=Melampsora larici-populina (strain 98AG31 / pathotype 3-4-7) TaxID=747676 RepID=F4RDG0_MELLP|nr:family 26 glycoside hydrolase [Melampsora larici-populina 98AG31]EGG09395.1 family 26 glycoside hydrolase [Melampsora larici-populina 98AG31]